jgi:branched-chain amino acid transport system substrate-binding protein
MHKKVVLLLIPLLVASLLMFPLLTRTTAATTIKIGVIGPWYLPQWGGGLNGHGGMIDGAQLAAKEINATGGINGQMIQIIPANEWAYDPLTKTYDVGKAIQSIDNLLNQGVQFIIGGFRTEVTAPIIEEVMDWNEANTPVPFFICGASTNELIRNLTDPTTYARYKWLFRVTPTNGTILFSSVVGYLKYYLIPNKLARMYGGNVKYAVFAEDLTWADQLVQYLQYIGLGPNATWVYTFRAPVTTTDFSAALAAAEAAGAHLIVNIFTLPLGPLLISQVNANQKKMLVVGIDVFAQLMTHWTATSGLCQYQVQMSWSATNQTIVPGLSEVFWKNYIDTYGEWPLYTSSGAYGAIYQLKEVIEKAKSTDPNVLLPYIEGIDTVVITGKFKYTRWHDLWCQSVGPVWPDGYSRTMMVQWMAKGTAGTTNLVSPVDQADSKKTLIPPWMYALSDYDLDFNGAVNIVDITKAAASYGTRPGRPGWNIEVDVDLNGQINIVDLTKIALNFGQKAPQWPLP